MLISKEQILQALSNQSINHKFDFEPNIDEIVIDSRKANKRTAFIAIKGENNDGNKFAQSALDNGCELAIVDNPEIFQNLTNAILVKNSFDALYDIASFQRSQTSAKIIALTGSVGKTSIKDMLKNAFSQIGQTHATSYNLNNHFGLPLTMSNIKKDDEFVILEIGMNNPGEIKPLSDLAKPDIAIISTIAAAHIGNFENEKAIALEKSDILSGLNDNGIAILNKDNKYYNYLEEIALKKPIKEQNIISFGYKNPANYQISDIQIIDANFSSVTIKNKDKTINYQISSSNKTVIFNSSIVFTCLDILTENYDKALEPFKSFTPSNGRGNIIKLDKFTIIDDSYNSNLTSSKAGVEYLSDLKTQIKANRSVAFLGDMLELGNYSDQYHQDLINFCQEKNIDQVILIGSEMQKAIKNLCIDLKNYLNCREVIGDLSEILQPGDLILVKGSRGVKMEEIIQNIKEI